MKSFLKYSLLILGLVLIIIDLKVKGDRQVMVVDNGYNINFVHESSYFLKSTGNTITDIVRNIFYYTMSIVGLSLIIISYLLKISKKG
jgi:hypothetical protein